MNLVKIYLFELTFDEEFDEFEDCVELTTTTGIVEQKEPPDEQTITDDDPALVPIKVKIFPLLIVVETTLLLLFEET